MKAPLLPLTSLRFFGAAAVLCYHRPRVPTDDWLPYERCFGAAVPFFFLLSGFILTYTYHDRFFSRRPGVTRDFLTSRLSRILPLYLLAFVIALWTCPEGKRLLTLSFGGALWPAVTHLTLTQSFVPNMNYHFGFNPPAWSMSCEWAFYLLFPLLILGLGTGSTLRRIGVFVAASAVWATVLVAYLAAPGDADAKYAKWFWLGSTFPLARVFDFVCGMALGMLFLRADPAIGLARGARFWAWGLAEVGALAALGATFHFCPVPGGARAGQTSASQMLIWQGYYLPALLLIVWVGALGRGPLSRALSWSPLVYLGGLSYGIYIFHAPLIRLTAIHFEPPAEWTLAQHLHAITAISVAAVLVVSVLAHHLYEERARRWLLRRLSGLTAARPEVPVLAFPQPDRRAA